MNPEKTVNLADSEELHLDERIGQATARRTYLRQEENGEYETRSELARRVVVGNTIGHDVSEKEKQELEGAFRSGKFLSAGRHLQHGDSTQKDKPLELLSNCFSGDTQILTVDHGIIELERFENEIVHVITADASVKPAVINYHGEQELNEIVVRPNFGKVSDQHKKTIKATPNHTWLLRDGSSTTDLKPGDVLASLGDVQKDPEAVIHGLIYGDGGATFHKSRKMQQGEIGYKQGKTYVNYRICDKGPIRDQIHEILDKSNYPYTTPPHAEGDRVYYIGKYNHAKHLPITNDPEYIAGFIYGWWLADGSKNTGRSTLQISTVNKEAVEWLRAYAPYAGLNFTQYAEKQRKDQDGSYKNGKTLYVVGVRKANYKVESITPIGKQKVYCPEEPETSTFVLANGIPTGNCSTSPLTSTLFLLLLNGSGVGRSYDDDIMLVDWTKQPKLLLALDKEHKDFGKDIDGSAWEDSFITMSEGYHQSLDRPSSVQRLIVEDSREGWANAVELLENITYLRTIGETEIDTLVLDFSEVRPKGTPIAGMQGRPASGPVPLMSGLKAINDLRDTDWAPWKTNMAVDHELAAIVAVGGIRRAARMATKNWRDEDIEGFIRFKRDHKLPNGKVRYNSSNNSVLVDEAFWDYTNTIFKQVDIDTRIEKTVTQWGPWASGYKKFTLEEIGEILDEVDPTKELNRTEAMNAANVFLAVSFCSYYDGTGEPGFINGDKLNINREGFQEAKELIQKEGLSQYVGYDRFKLSDISERMYLKIIDMALIKPMPFIVNPCSEIVLSIIGAYCIIGDIGLGNWTKNGNRMDLDQAKAEIKRVAHLAARFLMRVNHSGSLWHGEVQRTNRIGVGLTGIHEFALYYYGYGFKDLVDEKKSKDFWDFLAEVAVAVQASALAYSEEHGVTMPHTFTTIKPSGSISKLDNLTEGCHLPAKRMYLRNVQFSSNNPLVDTYTKEGYPVTELKSGQYKGVHIVGFPTRPYIDELAEELDKYDDLVMAAEATPEEQYKWIQNLEKYWLDGGGLFHGNQVSYTLKYDASETDFQSFADMMLQYQPTIRCCAVMPEFPVSIMPNPYDSVREIEKELGIESVDSTGAGFEYVPEQIVSYDVFKGIENRIHHATLEDIGEEHLTCDGEVCPIDFKTDI